MRLDFLIGELLKIGFSKIEKNYNNYNYSEYEELDGRYRMLSCENTRRARKIDTDEAYKKAQSREQLIRKAFFADCKRYLKEL